MKSSAVLKRPGMPVMRDSRAESLSPIKTLTQPDEGHAKAKTDRQVNIMFVHNLNLSGASGTLQDQRVPLLSGSRWADALGTFYNGCQFQASLAKELSRAERFNSPLTLVRCQVHKGTSGKLRKQVSLALAHACEASLRGYDYACRVARDEFALLLPEADRCGAHAVMQRIADAVEHALGSCTGWTLNVGIACFPFDGENSDALMAATGTNEILYGAYAHRTEINDQG
ncbi:MAG TPA: diguanylate cyclase [Nitrospiraceae bacterium]|nr:diguanylate cyclase [Nitrospiraceae bacterium]